MLVKRDAFTTGNSRIFDFQWSLNDSGGKRCRSWHPICIYLFSVWCLWLLNSNPAKKKTTKQNQSRKKKRHCEFPEWTRRVSPLFSIVPLFTQRKRCNIWASVRLLDWPAFISNPFKLKFSKKRPLLTYMCNVRAERCTCVGQNRIMTFRKWKVGCRWATSWLKLPGGQFSP